MKTSDTPSINLVNFPCSNTTCVSSDDGLRAESTQLKGAKFGRGCGRGILAGEGTRIRNSRVVETEDFNVAG